MDMALTPRALRPTAAPPPKDLYRFRFFCAKLRRSRRAPQSLTIAGTAHCRKWSLTSKKRNAGPASHFPYVIRSTRASRSSLDAANPKLAPPVRVLPRTAVSQRWRLIRISHALWPSPSGPASVDGDKARESLPAHAAQPNINLFDPTPRANLHLSNRRQLRTTAAIAELLPQSHYEPSIFFLALPTACPEGSCKKGSVVQEAGLEIDLRWDQWHARRLQPFARRT